MESKSETSTTAKMQSDITKENVATVGFCVFRLVTPKGSPKFWARVTGLLSKDAAQTYLNKHSKNFCLGLFSYDGHSSIPFKIFDGEPEMARLDF